MSRRAVVLAAGVGSRLRPLTDDRPKAMVSVGGEPLLVRLARQLARVGVDDLVIATGYRDEAIAAIDLPIPTRLRRNDRYDRTQNIASLAACLDALASPRETLLLDGDLFLDDALLPRLCAVALPEGEMLLGVDARASLGIEEMKAVVDRNRVVMLDKQIDPARAAGESIGVARLSAEALSLVIDEVGRLVTQGETGLYYEDAFNRLFARGLVARACDVGDLLWTEIDTAEDLAKAERLAAEMRTRSA